MAHATRPPTLESRRERLRELIERTEEELHRWDRARVALQENSDPVWAGEIRRRCDRLRARWVKLRERLDELRPQLQLPW